MQSMIDFFCKMSNTKKLVLLLTPILSTILSMKIILLGLILLLILDVLTGIRKSLHLRGIKFNLLKKVFYLNVKSYLVRRTWRKAYEYGVGIIVVSIFESMIIGVTPIELLGKSFTLSELSVLVACSVEVWSVFENMEAVSGNNLLKKLKGLLPEKLANLFTTSSTK